MRARGDGGSILQTRRSRDRRGSDAAQRERTSDVHCATSTVALKHIAVVIALVFLCVLPVGESGVVRSGCREVRWREISRLAAGTGRG